MGKRASKIILFILLSLPLVFLFLSFIIHHFRHGSKTPEDLFGTMMPLEKSPALDKLTTLGSNIVPMLEEKLKSESVNERYKAAWTLGALGTNATGAVPGLIKAMQDENSSVRYYSIASLAEIDSPTEELYPALVKALKDPNKSVSAQAAYLLNKIGLLQNNIHPNPLYSNELEYALTFIQSPSPEVRLMGVTRIARLSTQKEAAVATLRSLLTDSNLSVRENARFALRNFTNISTPTAK